MKKLTILCGSLLLVPALQAQDTTPSTWEKTKEAFRHAAEQVMPGYERRPYTQQSPSSHPTTTTTETTKRYHTTAGNEGTLEHGWEKTKEWAEEAWKKTKEALKNLAEKTKETLGGMGETRKTTTPSITGTRETTTTSTTATTGSQQPAATK